MKIDEGCVEPEVESPHLNKPKKGRPSKEMSDLEKYLFSEFSAT